MVCVCVCYCHCDDGVQGIDGWSIIFHFQTIYWLLTRFLDKTYANTHRYMFGAWDFFLCTSLARSLTHSFTRSLGFFSICFRRKYPVPHSIQVHGTINDSLIFFLSRSDFDYSLLSYTPAKCEYNICPSHSMFALFVR